MRIPERALLKRAVAIQTVRIKIPSGGSGAAEHYRELWPDVNPRNLPLGLGTAQKTTSARCPCSCGGFERHAVALALEEVDRAPRDALTVLSIVIIGTQLSIDRVIREDM